MKSTQARNAIVIENDKALAEMYALVLDFEGYRTQIAWYGGTGIDLLQTNAPHLILVNLKLPDMSSEDILKFIHAEKDLSNAWVIITTTEGQYFSAKYTHNYDFGFMAPLDGLNLHTLVKSVKNQDKIHQAVDIVAPAPIP